MLRDKGALIGVNCGRLCAQDAFESLQKLGRFHRIRTYRICPALRIRGTECAGTHACEKSGYPIMIGNTHDSFAFRGQTLFSPYIGLSPVCTNPLRERGLQATRMQPLFRSINFLDGLSTSVEGLRLN